jgi:putative resolvase
MEDEWIKPQDASQILKVTNKTLIEWDKQGKIRTIRTPSRQRRYNLQDVKNYADINLPSYPKKKKIKLCYCRVSSKKQIDDLERQKDFFRTKFPTHDLVTDIGSGLNWKRKGLQTILEQAMSRDISEVVVAHRDRLCRFAFELLEFIFSYTEVKLVVLNKTNEQSKSEELADDILSIIHVYSCREMGRRRYSKQKDTAVPDNNTEITTKTVDGD